MKNGHPTEVRATAFNALNSVLIILANNQTVQQSLTLLALVSYPVGGDL